MNKLILANNGIDIGNGTLLVALGVIAVALAIMGIYGTFMQWSVFFRYQANNRRYISNGRTAKQIAEEMLQKLGYTDISVRRTSYFWLLIFYKWGNRYSPKRRSIFLYGNILNKNTVTAVAIATQKVGLVIQHKNGEKKMKFRAKWELWTRLAPNMFIPIIAFGIAIDVACFNLAATPFGYITLGFAILSIVYTIIAFYCMYLIIPTERRAGELALEKIKALNLIPAEYIENVRGLYKAQVNVYIADFVLAILNLILDIIYVALKVAASRKR